jgi:hypothetical protein
MITRQTVLRTTVVAGLLAFGLAGCGMMSQSSSSSDTYTATLSGTQEVPANTSAGRGTAEVTHNKSANTVSWKVTYSGVSGPVTAGHIHGPAAAGANAGVMIPFSNVGTPTFSGQAAITPAQATELAAGRTYVNLHTAQFPGGEIRGQLRKR